MLLFFGCNTVMSLDETWSRDENILRYCLPKKCIHGVLTARSIHIFYDVVYSSFSIHSPQVPLSFSISAST